MYQTKTDEGKAACEKEFMNVCKYTHGTGSVYKCSYVSIHLVQEMFAYDYLSIHMAQEVFMSMIM